MKDIINMLLSTLLIGSALQNGLAQNLVPNPSFEDTVSCPGGPAQINYSTGWSDYNASPDYMNSCNASSMGVPNNWGGYQQAASGNAYAAIVTYSGPSPNAREFLGHQLASPLIIGVKYFVSFLVSLSLGDFTDANCATDKIGSKFFVVPYAGPSLINNNAHTYSNSIVTDSSNWTRVFGSFVADSSYDHILIGNFFDDLNTNVSIMGPATADAAYYYLDNICVSTDSLYSLNYSYTNIHKNETGPLIIYPNPASDYLEIRSLTQSKTCSIKVYNCLGELLLSNEKMEIDGYKVSLIGINKGILFLNVRIEESIYTYKIIKQ